MHKEFQLILTPEEAASEELFRKKVAEKAEWDFDLLNAELDDIIDLDMELFGFEDALQDDAEEAVEDEFEVELPAEPKSKLGDIYQLGNNRLMCGDSTVLEDVEKLMGGGASRHAAH